MEIDNDLSESESDFSYEFENDSNISDTDSIYSTTDDEEGLEPVEFDGWHLIPDPFVDKLPEEPAKFSAEYDFHPALRFEELKSAAACFEAFISPQIVRKLCQWTNERAKLYFTKKNGKEQICGLLWKPVFESEMYTFIILHFLTGFTKCPRIADYWSSSNLCSGPKVFNKHVMSRNRFLAILKFIRFSPPSSVKKGAPLTRLGIFISMLKDNCQILVDPGETFAIDEQLMLYKGRLHFRQYIQSKRNRFGIKIFTLCPSAPELRGYTWSFCVYVGKDLFDVSHIPGTANLTVSERIVVHLASFLLNQGREIILDNWYVSVRLAEFLLSQKTYLTGTIRPNRGVPKQLLDLPLVRYQSCFARKNMMLLVRFKDKKDVFVLTTKHTAGMSEKSRYLCGGKQVHFTKPKHIEFYNQNMGAVDAIDQDLEPYNCLRKSYTWSSKVGFQLLQQMLLNSKVIYANAHGNTISMYEYMKICCHEVLMKYNEGYVRLQTTAASSTSEALPHVMADFPKVPGKRPLRKVCVICKKNGIRKLTRKACFGCVEKPGLCCVQHFVEFHANNE